MDNRWLQSLNSLPGPMWLFGGFAVVRAGVWLNTTIVSLINGTYFLGFSWIWGFMSLQSLVVSLLPLLLLWFLLARKPYAVSLVGWYAAGRALACVLAMIVPVINDPVPPLASYGELTGNLLRAISWGVVWVGLMLYIERSQSLAAAFPPEGRRTLWWVVALIVVLCLLGG